MTNRDQHDHDYFLQTVIFLRLVAKGFDQSTNLLELDSLDFSPVSFNRYSVRACVTENG